MITGSTSAAGSVNVCAGLVATECLKEATQCFWKDAATPAPVDPTKPVTEEGRCQLNAAITAAMGSASLAGGDVCVPIKDKTACYQMNGQCEWINTPIVAPVDPVPTDIPSHYCRAIDASIPPAADNCINIKAEASCLNL